MACGCGGTKSNRQQVQYVVRFKDGTSRPFPTSQEAQAAIRAAGGGSMRPTSIKR